MDSRRRYRGGFSDQQVQGRISHNRRPPPGNWQPTVPLWEKQFCSSVGSVPWKKLLETKRYMYIYENVVNWNDSACEEAFNNAKSRYWAEINGLHCDILLPDRDTYIDEIDWNSEGDPEFIWDLERAFEEVGYYESGVIVNMHVLLNESGACTGWGDESDFPKDTGLVLASGYGDCAQNGGDDNNSWEQNCAPYNGIGKDNRWGDEWNFQKDAGMVPPQNGGDDKNSWKRNYAPYNGTGKDDDGWRSYFNDSWGCNQQGSNYNKWVRNVDDQRGGGDWRSWNYDNEKRDSTGCYMSRYKTTRFSGDETSPMDRGWRNKRGWKKSNIACR